MTDDTHDTRDTEGIGGGRQPAHGGGRKPEPGGGREPEPGGGRGPEPGRGRTPAPDGGRENLVLVPLRVLEGEGVPTGAAQLLSTMDVVLLGYHQVPEQTVPDQMRKQFEPQASRTLEELAEIFATAGGDADTRLVFTHDREQTVRRVANEVGATAILYPKPVADVDEILVPLRGDVDAARIARFVAALRGDRDIDVTLFAASTEARAEAAQALVDTAADVLIAAGVPEDAVISKAEVTSKPVDAIIQAATTHDATVMGEREPDWRSMLFGELEDRIAKEGFGPVIVVGSPDSS